MYILMQIAVSALTGEEEVVYAKQFTNKEEAEKTKEEWFEKEPDYLSLIEEEVICGL